MLFEAELKLSNPNLIRENGRLSPKFVFQFRSNVFFGFRRFGSDHSTEPRFETKFLMVRLEENIDDDDDDDDDITADIVEYNFADSLDNEAVSHVNTPLDGCTYPG